MLLHVVARRLADGHTAESLAADLQTRLPPEDASALIAAARDLRRRRVRSPLARGLAGYAYLWTAVLIFQHASILMFMADNRVTLERVGVMAQLRIIVLVLTAGAWWGWRNAVTATLYAAVLLIASPPGVWVERMVWPQDYVGLPDPGPTLSDLLSFAAAAAIQGRWWLGRRETMDRAPGPRL